MNKLISLLFYSRDVAHREHLKTQSFAQHIALGSFYSDVIGLTDSLAEAYQGRSGIIEGIEFLNMKTEGTIADTLSAHLGIIEDMRKTISKDDSAIQNIIDEIVGLYLSTLYKLRNLK